ncbi:hypothetical protein QNI19_03835 [Cytophagaceae bacterium DM2B3-1]|uniref:Uncharacterized protein n=1 Tax=Xanthocytophaga flava TaxID=3048013 RepID=A0ABT7CEC8_9BACT|nr:hypothetical protein [Xanthocytophaga flavus]MDJ1492048.1 hypothetical protein [Xanthocytophaga flavus]
MFNHTRQFTLHSEYSLSELLTILKEHTSDPDNFKTQGKDFRGIIQSDGYFQLNVNPNHSFKETFPMIEGTIHPKGASCYVDIEIKISIFTYYGWLLAGLAMIIYLLVCKDIDPHIRILFILFITFGNLGGIFIYLPSQFDEAEQKISQLVK